MQYSRSNVVRIISEILAFSEGYSRDYLPRFFLQTEADKNIQLILKLIGAVAILLVESDEKRWSKHLQKENGKSIIYMNQNKVIYGTMNAALLAYKKLAKLFLEWGCVMNTHMILLF